MQINARLRALIAAAAAVILLLAAVALARKWAGPQTPAAETQVMLNTKTMLYHCPACALAQRCGKECVIVDLFEARRRGGKPCEVCGGVCLAARRSP